MYGNLNPGLLICRLTSEESGNPIKAATAQITWVEADSSFGGRLQLYDKSGIETRDVSAESDTAGIAFVEFFWNPTQIGYFVSNSPQIRVFGFGGLSQEITERGFLSDTEVKRNFETKSLTDRMHLCTNLGQVMKPGQGVFQFKQPVLSGSISVAEKIKKLLEYRAKIVGAKLPPLQFLKIMRPGIEMVSLLGAVEIAIKPY